MERYYKRKSSLISSDNHIPNSSPSNLDSSNPIPNSSPTSAPIPNSSDPIGGNSTPQQNELKVDLDNLERDPGKRIPMKDYPPNIRDGSVVNVLEMIVDDNTNDSVAEANRLLRDIQSFEFVFLLFLMKSILGITNDLSQALQKNHQEIVNAMALVNTCKEQLLYMRNDEGFDLLVDKVSSFCVQHHIEIINMDEAYVAQGRSRRNTHKKTNRHRYKVELFFVVIDSQLTELNDRFNETSTELLICLASLSPNDSFIAFNKEKLLRLAQLYPQDFTKQDLLALKDQLDIYIHSMHSRSEFSQLQSISDLAKKMVEKGLHRVFQYVYLLIELALVLPVATASVERAFSAMNIIKSPLHNRMGDQWLNDSLVVYIEKDVFSCIDNETIMTRFQSMKSRRGQI
nr:zinc finger MYM-type protein 1-like [Malus domestica]